MERIWDAHRNVSHNVGKILNNLARGVGTLLDISPAPRRGQAGDRLPPLSDAEAIRKDWQQVGEDLWEAINNFDSERQLHDTKKK